MPYGMPRVISPIVNKTKLDLHPSNLQQKKLSIKHPIHPSHGKNCHQGDTVVIQRSIRARCTPHLSDLFGHTKNHGGHNEKHLTADFLYQGQLLSKKKTWVPGPQIPEKWELHKEKFFWGGKIAELWDSRAVISNSSFSQAGRLLHAKRLGVLF